MKGNFIFGFMVAAMVFVPLERFFALRPEQKIFRKGWRTDVVHFLVNRFMIDAGVFFVVGLLVVLLHGLVSPRLQAAVASQPRILQFVEAVLVAEIGGYFGHRLTHQVPWLWRFHAVHHSIEEMDWLAAARLHPLDQTFTRSLAIIPLYMLGFTRATFGFYLVLATFQAIFIHSNVRFRFRRLRWLLATPQFHHWHHSTEPEALNKNFAGQLPVLDLVFGTAYLPEGMPGRYGSKDGVPAGYGSQMVFPFKKRTKA
jgi:sterol desaturase/sphingolipid hydroxylase (fatty acid hydroxylase superfamily)